jgi:hypothetical protein
MDNLVTVSTPLLKTLKCFRASHEKLSCLGIERSEIEVSQYPGDDTHYCISSTNMKRKAFAFLTVADVDLDGPVFCLYASPRGVREISLG